MRGSISGTYFYDTNRNSVFDAGDTAISGMEVRLLQRGVVDSQITDVHGRYRFEDLEAENYWVDFLTPETDDDMVFVTADAGRPNRSSHVDQLNAAGRLMANKETVFDDQNTVVNAGLTLARLPVAASTVPGGAGSDTGIVKGTVYQNLNNDPWFQAASDQTLAGITVILRMSGGTRVDSAVTRSNGFFNFGDVPLGDYYVQVQPGGFDFVTPKLGPDAVDSDITNVARGITDVFSLGAQTPMVIQAGLSAPLAQAAGRLVGIVYENQDKTSSFSAANDRLLPNVTVNLLDENGAVIATTTTMGAKGFFSFDKVAAGDYYVQVDAPNGMQFVKPGIGKEGVDSDITNRATGRSELITVKADEVSRVQAGLEGGQSPVSTLAEPSVGTVGKPSVGTVAEPDLPSELRILSIGNSYQHWSTIDDDVYQNAVNRGVQVNALRDQDRTPSNQFVKLAKAAGIDVVTEMGATGNIAFSARYIEGGATLRQMWNGQNSRNQDTGSVVEINKNGDVIWSKIRTDATGNIIPSKAELTRTEFLRPSEASDTGWVRFKPGSVETMINEGFGGSPYDLIIVNGAGAGDFPTYAQEIAETADATGASTLFFGLWSYAFQIDAKGVDGGPQIATRNHTVYSNAAKDLDAGYSPTGQAWLEAYAALSEAYGEAKADDLLYDPADGIHASPIGAYLAANTTFASLFGNQAPTPDEWMPEVEANLLRGLRDGNGAPVQLEDLLTQLQEIAQDAAADYAVQPSDWLLG